MDCCAFAYICLPVDRNLNYKNTIPLITHTCLLAIILIGFSLRTYNLTYHSIWFDESVSIRWAKESVPRILDVSLNLVEDRLPPLYYLLLKFWGTLVGLSEWSVRYPSVIFGVLLIPIMYKIGSRLFNSEVGLVTAMLTACNPFLIWYSQEARMYSLAVCLASLAVLCFIYAMPNKSGVHCPSTSKGRGWGGVLAWIGFGLASLAGLYTHLYTGFLLPALLIWLLITPRYFKKVWLSFGLTMGTVSFLFFPLAIANWRFSGESSSANPLIGMGERAFRLLEAFVMWKGNLSSDMRTFILGMVGIFVIIGIMIVIRHAYNRLIILLLITPFIIASILLIRSDLAFYGERYFIIMVPWMLLLVAVGITTVSKQLKTISRYAHLPFIVSFIMVMLIPLPGQWHVSSAKEAWRQTTAYLTSHAHADESIFIHPEWVRFPYQYYAGYMNTPGKTYAAFFAVDENTELDAPLNGVVKNHPVVWLIQSHTELSDPDLRVENWFAERYPLVTELYPPGIKLKGYAPGYQYEQLPYHAIPTNITFSEGLHVIGYEIDSTLLIPHEDLFHPPSNWIHVTLYWTADLNTPDIFPYVHLIDNFGAVWGASLERGNDSFHFYPPSRWQAGQIIRHDVDVNLNPNAPPSNYNLVVGIDDVKQKLIDIILCKK